MSWAKCHLPGLLVINCSCLGEPVTLQPLPALDLSCLWEGLSSWLDQELWEGRAI